MNCQGVRAVLNKGFSKTTVAERNASCVHCRTCEHCQAVLVEEIRKIPPEQLALDAIAAMHTLARDRSDPEWK